MKRLLILLFITILTTHLYAQKIDKAKKETAYKIINLIKEKDYEKIKKCFPPEIGLNIPDNTLKYYVDMGAGFISEYGIPKEDELISKVKFAQTKEGTIQIYSIVFPFPAPKEKYTMPERIIEIGFIEKYGNDKITNIQVAELKPVQTIEQSNIKFLDKLKFGTDSISNWRIYYSRGNVKNIKSINPEVFAVSGNKQKLSDLKIDTLVQIMFNNLEKAPIKEKKFQNDITRYNGRPETISFRWQYKGDNQFYSMQIIILEDSDVSEKLNEFVEVNISVFANEASIYLIKKTDLDQLIKILTDFSKKDWGDNYEENP